MALTPQDVIGLQNNDRLVSIESINYLIMDALFRRWKEGMEITIQFHYGAYSQSLEMVAKLYSELGWNVRHGESWITLEANEHWL